MKSKKPKVSARGKVESVQEYLARGGSIQIVPPALLEPVPDVTRKTTNGGPAVFLTLEEADLFFGEPSKKKPKKAKASSKIDLNDLPPALRAKFISKLKEETNGEGYEEELEEIDGDED
jgi:hypothetical protein